MNNRMQTVQEINAHTSAEAKAIRSEILTAAQSIIGTLKAESATIVRAIVALKESNVATAKGEAVAREAMKTEDLYGKAAQPAGLCGTSSLGAGIQLGAQAGKEVHATMREKQLEYANSPEAKPVEFLQRVLAEDHPTEKEAVETFFPLEGTLTEDEVAKAHETVKTLGNPRPLPVTTDGQKETPAGQTYEAARKIHESRIAVIAENLNAHVVHHAPTLPDDVPPGRKTSGPKPEEAAIPLELWMEKCRKRDCTSFFRKCAWAIRTGLIILIQPKPLSYKK